MWSASSVNEVYEVVADRLERAEVAQRRVERVDGLVERGAGEVGARVRREVAERVEAAVEAAVERRQVCAAARRRLRSARVIVGAERRSCAAAPCRSPDTSTSEASSGRWARSERVPTASVSGDSAIVSLSACGSSVSAANVSAPALKPSAIWSTIGAVDPRRVRELAEEALDVGLVGGEHLHDRRDGGEEAREATRAPG